MRLFTLLYKINNKKSEGFIKINFVLDDMTTLADMATQLKQMSGEELVEKILAGERDFSGIELEERFDLAGSKHFGQLQKYLKNEDLRKSPVSIVGSELKYLDARGLHTPYVRGERANLERANLWKANLSEANFREANLERANLYGSNLERANLRKANLVEANLEIAYLGGADLSEANFREANLREANLSGANLERAYLGGAYLGEAYLWKANLGGANLERANFERADLGGADLRGVIDLEHAKNIEYAVFNRTKVTETEKGIIEEAMKKKHLFVLC